jgi:hypothetical protein
VLRGAAVRRVAYRVGVSMGAGLEDCVRREASCLERGVGRVEHLLVGHEDKT